jgi:hypothetical protein
MKIPNTDILIWVLIFIGFGIYGFATLPNTVESFQIVKAIASSWTVLTGLLLLVRFRWAAEMFALTMLFFSAYGAYNLVNDGYSHMQLLTAVGPWVVLAGWYLPLRRALRATEPSVPHTTER